MDDPMKDTLQRYLQTNREALLWKLEGLGERDLRLPRTATGLNLLGIVKHMTHVEVAYLGDTFARTWPTPGELIADEVFETDPQADWYATSEESAEGIIDLYRRVWAFCDATIATLSLDARGTVPHWPTDRASITLHTAIIHVIVDLARHVGQADVLRESIDGEVGLQAGNTNVPEGEDWEDYVAKLTRLADVRGDR